MVTELPITRIGESTKDFYDVEVPDNYSWLEDSTSDEATKWIVDQNLYTKSFFAKSKNFSRVKRRITELMFRGGYRCVSSRKRGDNVFSIEAGPTDRYGSVYVTSSKGEKRYLVSLDSLVKDELTSCNGWSSSPCGNFVVVSLNTVGSRDDLIKIISVNDYKEIDNLSFVFPQMCWNTNPGRPGFWYVRREYNDQGGVCDLGINYYDLSHYLNLINKDKVFLNKDKIFLTSASLGLAGDCEISLHEDRYLLIQAFYFNPKEESCLYFVDLEAPTLDPIPITVRVEDWDVQGVISSGKIFMTRGGKDFMGEVLVSSLDDFLQGVVSFEVIVPESKRLIRKILVQGKTLVVYYLEDMVSCFSGYDFSGKEIFTTELPELGSVSGNCFLEDDKRTISFYLTSLLTPYALFKLDTDNGDLNCLSSANYEGVDKDDYVVKVVWFNSWDKTLVPIVLFHKKDIRLNGKNPMLMYSYGGFNVVTLPVADAHVMSFVENGGVYALVPIRGGGEFGENWHRAGSGKNKDAGFKDLVASAEWLIKKRYTNKGRLAFRGGSNGGLLAGVIMTKRPDLFKAIIMSVPVTDMTDGFIYRRSNLVREYGDPNNKEELKSILSYSPYHNVRFGISYPAVLITTGIWDDNVPPHQSYKMVALLQNLTDSSPDRNPTLLKVGIHNGHGFPPDIGESLELMAEETTFLFDLLGM